LRHSLSRLPLRKTTLLKQVLRQNQDGGTANARGSVRHTSEVAKTLQVRPKLWALRDGRELEVNICPKSM